MTKPALAMETHSDSGKHSLEAVIREHLAEWDTPHVDLAIYGCADAKTIARSLDELCRRELGAPVRQALFYQASIGAVAGVELAHGRRVVIKAYQPDRTRARLAEVVRLQMHVHSELGFAPRVLAGPLPLARGLALVEEYADHGSSPDAHKPEVRRALASSLHAVIHALEPFVATSALGPQLLFPERSSALWPTPHSRLFDFEATREGAADIDALATSARARMVPAGRVVLGHGDWRAEHVRFVDNEPVMAFDWDSLCTQHESALLGFTAHAFCADWSRSGVAQAPSLEEARALVEDYERARSAPLEPAERALCAAAFAYSVAYTARCSHALGLNTRQAEGTFQHLVARHGEELLAL
jgi:hypothetical protein